jgi:hypothetical protein
MACKTTGSPNNGLVTIDVGKGEFVRHTVTASGAQATCVIQDEKGSTILSSEANPTQGQYECDWKPGPGDTGRIQHVLVVTFPFATQYGWKVEHCNRDGSLKSLIRDIAITGDPGDECKPGITILLA